MPIRRLLLPAGAAFAALFLGGCLAHHDGPIALSSATAPSVGDDDKPKPVAATVKQTEALPPTTAPFGRPEQIPTADKIFDFHPAGTKASQWRQPFEIEDHGGPLEIYRKQTAAMLKQLQDPKFQQTVPQGSSPAGQGVPQSR